MKKSLILALLISIFAIVLIIPTEIFAAPTVDELLQRIEELEQRVAELEKILGSQQTEVQSSTKQATSTSRVVASFKGSGIVNTKPFKVNDSWNIEWDSKGYIFQVYVFTESGELVGVAANQMGPGQGSSFQPRGGSYYLEVNAMGDWKIDITQ